MGLKRITPRTCLWPLTGSLILTFGLSIGLTFRSNDHCYAGVCGEWLFPLQARLHVVVWYCWISLSVTILALRAFHPSIRRILQRQIIGGQVPVAGKALTISGVLVIVWVLSLFAIITGIWWLRLQDYFDTRGREGDILAGNNRLAAVALTGHYADVTLGMVLLPVRIFGALAAPSIPFLQVVRQELRGPILGAHVFRSEAHPKVEMLTPQSSIGGEEQRSSLLLQVIGINDFCFSHDTGLHSLRVGRHPWIDLCFMDRSLLQ